MIQIPKYDKKSQKKEDFLKSAAIFIIFKPYQNSLIRMKKVFFSLFFSIFLYPNLIGQKHPLSYYLPEIKYQSDIPTPEAFFGFQIGDWHLSHDQLLSYLKHISDRSPRAKWVEHGRTYEGRPLIHLVITSEQNHKNLEALRLKHLANTNPDLSPKLNPEEVPLVFYLGNAIHGNEASGFNAGPLIAYYMLAGNSESIQKFLDKCILIFDPSLNPDGAQRFSTWANMHKNENLTDDNQDREYNEAWPGGRSNHYWFDLNRDWLSIAHPESRGRISVFHHWKPNVLTDHHEMGTNSTFFFMPGVPSRVNPNTPKKNQQLTAKIGQYHAKALDKIGSLYYSEEGYDDFYYGKGSTFPDANGCVGILFEQASSRGHLQQSENGPLTFPFTIRNQVTTALSSMEASSDLRLELLEHQREFFINARKEAAMDLRKAIVFADKYDPARVHHFIEILRRQQIKVHHLAKPVTVEGKAFEPSSAFIIPMEQDQYKLIMGAFQTLNQFEDSIFYDISTWTLPHAFNLSYQYLPKASFDVGMLGKEITGLGPDAEPLGSVAKSHYAYLMEWDNYYAPKALYHIQKAGIRTKVFREGMTLGEKKYQAGTILIPVQNQILTAEQIHSVVSDASKGSNIPIEPVFTGLTVKGIDLGSNGLVTLEIPKVVIIVGEGTSSSTVGEVWHLLDQRYGMVVSKMEANRVSRSNLSRYNVLVLGGGSYQALGTGGVTQIKEFVQGGGTIIGIQSAINWLKSQNLVSVSFREVPDKEKKRRPYGAMTEDLFSLEIPGTIFEADLDLSHPIGFGYRNQRIPVFKDGDLLLEPAKNAYATPLIYTSAPLLSGYLPGKYIGKMGGTAGVVVGSSGSGKIIMMADNPNFRAHWYGTNKLFANAVFFPKAISLMGTEAAPRGVNE